MLRLELCIYHLLLVLALVLVGCSSTPEVEVTPTNNVPLADTQSYNTSQDTPLVLTLSGTDPDGDTLLYTVTQQPSNGTLGAIDQASGEVTYTPTSGFSGKDAFTYTVSDNTTTSAEATVTISVTRSNTGPAATNQTLSTSENTPLTLTLTGNDPDGDALTFTIIQQPSLGQLGKHRPGDGRHLIHAYERARQVRTALPLWSRTGRTFQRKRPSPSALTTCQRCAYCHPADAQHARQYCAAPYVDRQRPGEGAALSFAVVDLPS